MKKALNFLILVFITSQTCFGQIDIDTIYHKKTEIRIYTYLLGNDTVAKAYFDMSLPRVTGKVSSNLGETTRDLTFDSIADFVRNIYPQSSITATDLKAGELTTFNPDIKPNSTSLISIDCYWIGGINHYSKEIVSDSSNFLNYFNLANALNQYYLWAGPYEKIITLLNSCIELNKEFEEAYILKAKMHEDNGVWKGIIMSEPHIDIVDRTEIELAISCLDELLKINPKNRQAKDLKIEIINKHYK